ncbi:hypothetical protein ACFL5R_02335, partial [Pseudomonadota bacterium]
MHASDSSADNLRGFKAIARSGKGLPYALKQTMYTLVQFKDNQQALKRLAFASTAIGKIQVRQRELCAQILCVMVRFCDVENGNIGIAKPNYMDTVTHQDLIREYERSFGPIHRSRWFRGIALLKCAGYLDVMAVNIDVSGQKQYRAKAAYKTLTDRFFSDTGVMHRDDVKKSVAKAKSRRLGSGLSNVFPTYQQLKTLFLQER